MSYRQQCDRCGEIVPEGQRTTNVTDDPHLFGVTRYAYGRSAKPFRVDLCDGCMTGLREYLGVPEEWLDQPEPRRGGGPVERGPRLFRRSER